MRHASKIATQEKFSYYSHIDSDELIYAPNGLEPVLRQFRENVGALQLPVLEAVTSQVSASSDQFECEYFLNPRRFKKLFFRIRSVHRVILGARQRYSRFGALGYTQGKTIYKVPIAYKNWNMHGPESNRVNRAKGAFILHFDSSNFNLWKEKWIKRTVGGVTSSAMADIRQQQSNSFAANASSESALRCHYMKYIVLSPLRIMVLRFLGVITHTNSHGASAIDAEENRLKPR